MANKHIILAVLILLSGIFVYPQPKHGIFSIAFSGNYTTSSRLYLSPKSSDPELRNSSYEIDDILSPSVEACMRIGDGLFLSLGTEYIRKTKGGIYINVFEENKIASVEVEDGYVVIPAELSLHYLLPVSSKTFKLYIYGGAAYYYGKHVRKLGNAETETVDRKFSYGIQTGVDFEYAISNMFSIKSGLKFRDPEISLTTGYKNSNINYNNTVISPGKNNFDSKINLNGIVYSLGFKIDL